MHPWVIIFGPSSDWMCSSVVHCSGHYVYKLIKINGDKEGEVKMVKQWKMRGFISKIRTWILKLTIPIIDQ